MKKISIVVPVYNTSKYLNKCLDSLVNQTIMDIEIIVIDDGSTDNSREIIDKYVIKYPKLIKTIYQDNSGVSVARNKGIIEAKGEYIGFVDSDDYVDVLMFEKLYNKAITEDYDVVCCDLLVVYEKKTKKMDSNVKNDLLTKKSIQDNMNYINATLCNKIYKTSILKNNLFSEGMKYEDVDFLYRLYPKINNMGTIKENLYFYNQRGLSSTHTYNKDWYKLIDNFEDIFKYYIDNNIYDNYYQELEYAYVRYCFATVINKIAKAKNYKLYLESVEYALKKVENKFPKYKQNKYLKKFNFKSIYLKKFNKVTAKLFYNILKR